jgi:hypothetical protein
VGVIRIRRASHNPLSLVKERVSSMKRSGLISLAILLSTTAVASAKPTVRTITGNEYGGKTEFVTYSEEDREFRDGISGKTTSYDNKGQIVRVEVHATPGVAEREGWETRVTYYWGNKKIGEVYSTDSHSETAGFYQTVDYLDKNGNLKKREFYVRPTSVIGTIGVYKRVIYYDEKGNQTKFDDLDRVGNPVTISLEDYRRAQEKVQGSKQEP